MRRRPSIDDFSEESEYLESGVDDDVRLDTDIMGVDTSIDG
jgi:hypothetical protein